MGNEVMISTDINDEAEIYPCPTSKVMYSLVTDDHRMSWCYFSFDEDSVYPITDFADTQSLAGAKVSS